MKCVISFKVVRKYDESGTRIIESCNMVESMDISLMRIYERINDARKKLDIVGDVNINFVEEE